MRLVAALALLLCSGCLDFGGLESDLCRQNNWPDCASGGGAGSDAGSAGKPCDRYGQCDEGQYCDLQQNRCTVGATCNGQGRTTCPYGQVCELQPGGAAQTCGDPDRPTCLAFSSTGPHPAVWDSRRSGAVIWRLRRGERNSALNCASGERYAVDVDAYSSGATWPVQDSAGQLLPPFELHSVRDNGTESSHFITNFLRVSNTEASFTVNYCANVAANVPLNVALHFVDGNEVCFVAQYP